MTVQNAGGLRKSLEALALGFIGGLGILASRTVIGGTADPFGDGWPLGLQAAALVAALGVTLLVRRPAAAAFGVYGGLVAYMLADGGAEYPAASAIALAVHGLVPAAVGSALAVFWASSGRGRAGRGEPGRELSSGAP